MRYAIHDASGRIVRTIQCAESDLAPNMLAGESATEVDSSVNDSTHYIGPQGTPEAFPEQPTLSHVFNFLTTQWEDVRSLQDLKDAAWSVIKTSRESAIDANLVTPYGTFDCKAKDRTNMTDAVLMLQTLNAIGQPTTIDFTLADNSTVVLTTTEMVTVALMLGQKVQAAHSQARALRASIDAASSAAELELISWV